MNSSIYAHFDTTDAAEAAALRLRNQVTTIQKTDVMTYHRESLLEDVTHLTKTTLLPTAVTSYNYITMLMETELDRESIPEPLRRQDALLHTVCADDDIHQVKQIITALGGSGQQTYSLQKRSRMQLS